MYIFKAYHSMKWWSLAIWDHCPLAYKSLQTDTYWTMTQSRFIHQLQLLIEKLQWKLSNLFSGSELRAVAYANKETIVCFKQKGFSLSYEMPGNKGTIFCDTSERRETTQTKQQT